MRKQIFSLTLDPEIIERIGKVAHANNITKSAAAGMILEVIRYIPIDKFRKTSPITDFLGISKKEADHAD